MSDTPRTDNQANSADRFWGLDVVPARFAQQLERELNEAQAKLAESVPFAVSCRNCHWNIGHKKRICSKGGDLTAATCPLNEDEMKKCEKCKHWSGTLHRFCLHGKNRFAVAETERMEGNCGPDGKLFEPKEEE